jgi:D-arabinitol 4-dehydrogenase
VCKDRPVLPFPQGSLQMTSSSKYRMLHLGLGSFHRAHQAVYMHQLQQLGDHSWTLSGGNIRADVDGTITALQKQHGAYTLETVTPQGVHHYTRVESIQTVVPYAPGVPKLVDDGADADTRIISFTVTEAGYYFDAQNRLDSRSADIVSDLHAARGRRAGQTIYGALTAILQQRMVRKSGPVTLLNCDNLRHNGDRVRAGLLEFIELLEDIQLYQWVQTNTSCPNAMVDRITPRPTADVALRVKAVTGWDDQASVMGESFIQWVIEDNFIAGRPAWEKVGVEMVKSVAPYEEAKIRLLNATHSCIAWAGTLAGYTYIHEGCLDKEIRQLAFDYVSNDTIPVLLPSPIDLAQYRDTVLDRFANPSIADTNQRVAMDGFSKIPGFIAPTIRERLARKEPIDSVAVLPALFLAYLHQWHRNAIAYTYQDQAMNPQHAHAICDATDTVEAFCHDDVLWGDLKDNTHLVKAVRAAYDKVENFTKVHAK